MADTLTPADHVAALIDLPLSAVQAAFREHGMGLDVTAELIPARGRRVYFEPRDVWVGYYRGEDHHYVCPLPCLVFRWPRRTR